jgi:hypothetical protein
MEDALLKLFSVASEPLLPTPSPPAAENLQSIIDDGDSLYEMLSLKNGWYAFESALHLFPLGYKNGILDLAAWNSDALWKSEYRGMAENCLCFAEDLFGMQFCVKDRKISTFDPETGETTFFANRFGEWAERILEEYSLHTGYLLGHAWQSQNRPLKEGERLLPKIPFIFQGPYSLENLYASDSVKGMRFRATIALQIRELPDGSKIKLKMVR